MFYDAIKNQHGLKHDPFKALVAPRPIGWVSSKDKEGNVNLAPYSFFNAVNDKPHIVMFSSSGPKDSSKNIEETGEFVCNIATWDLRDAMNLSSMSVKSDINEFHVAGLTEFPCQYVSVPRVKEAPVALECKFLQALSLEDIDGNIADARIVFGQVVGIYIDDYCIENGIVDVTKYKPISRLGYKDYAVVDELFELSRPRKNDVLESLSNKI